MVYVNWEIAAGGEKWLIIYYLRRDKSLGLNNLLAPYLFINKAAYKRDVFLFICTAGGTGGSCFQHPSWPCAHGASMK